MRILRLQSKPKASHGEAGVQPRSRGSVSEGHSMPGKCQPPSPGASPAWGASLAVALPGVFPVCFSRARSRGQGQVSRPQMHPDPLKLEAKFCVRFSWENHSFTQQLLTCPHVPGSSFTARIHSFDSPRGPGSKRTTDYQSVNIPKPGLSEIINITAGVLLLDHL